MSVVEDAWARPAFDLARGVGALERLRGAEGGDGLQQVLDRARREVRNAGGRRLRVVEGAAASAADYERAVHAEGRLGVRAQTWHDRFNVLAWSLFPRTKAALNARHVVELEQPVAPGRRSPVRDALSLFDEDGVVVAVADPRLEQLVRGFEWRALFLGERARLQDAMLCVPVGHALMEKLLDPFVGLVGKAVFVPVEASFFGLDWSGRNDVLDEGCAAAVAGLSAPVDLAPLPVLGLPGWWDANERPEFYDNAAYFRPGRRRTATAPAAPIS
jgi:hypothetical protein